MTMTDLNHLKQQILAKTPLDQLIGEQVTLQSRAGKKMGCCPFHAEKTPSFYLYDDHSTTALAAGPMEMPSRMFATLRALDLSNL